MKRIVLVLAAFALLVVVVYPAVAQVDFEAGQETDDTGEVGLETGVESTGNNSTQCVAPLQFGNTGNLQNAQGFLQYESSADDVEFSGGEFIFAPEQTVVCGQAVEQAAAASSF